MRAFDSFPVCLVVAHTRSILYHMLIHPSSRGSCPFAQPYRPLSPHSLPPTADHQARAYVVLNRGAFTQLTSVATPAVSSRQTWCCYLNYHHLARNGPEPSPASPFIHNCYHLPPPALSFSKVFDGKTFDSLKHFDQQQASMDGYGCFTDSPPMVKVYNNNERQAYYKDSGNVYTVRI